MKKYMLDFRTKEVKKYEGGYSLLILSPLAGKMPECEPGQFVEVQKQTCGNVLLRRPISINRVDKGKNEIWLLIKDAGIGTHEFCESRVGDVFNLILPLGKGFSIKENKRPLLVGGGVGVAPLLYLAEEFKSRGILPTILLGARSKKDLLMTEYFKENGELYITTEDGTEGIKGLVTHHPVLTSECDIIYCCGPLIMMKAVAEIAKEKGVSCEVSLENRMACGVGACLCCVENTKDGNRCVCTDGPVFNIDELKW